MSQEDWDATSEPINVVQDDEHKYKCPDFPYCKVMTPFSINLITAKDMKHFLRYHG